MYNFLKLYFFSLLFLTFLKYKYTLIHLWGRICSKPASNLSALGLKDSYGFVLCKWCEQFLKLAPTSKKDAPHMNGTLLPLAKAYKVWVGRIFLRCGSKSQKLLTSLVKNKAVWILWPQSGQTACRLGTNPPLQHF